MKIPKKFQGILWSVNTDNLDLKRDRYYIIHQMLIYGGFGDLKWLFKHYSRKEITKVFLKAYKNYPKNVFYFVKNYILNLKNIDLDEDDYVTSIHGPIRPRAATSFPAT